ncbi:MAG: hypothetical protein IIA61_14060 [Candidatus Marinimicrobia bacterium]|nr:hypothetical protein [Candidatus Neomarinimicrobiota bacterium]
MRYARQTMEFWDSIITGIWNGIIQFILAVVLWFMLLGWIIHLWSVIDAAKFYERENR